MRGIRIWTETWILNNVKAQFFRTTWPSKKLSDKFLGPYKILALPGTHSVTLQLLDSLRAVHPGFHISMLESATPNLIPDRIKPPPPPIIVDNEPEFEISEILDSKIDNRHCAWKLLYLFHWRGYECTDKKLPGSSLLNLDMLPNSLWISTLPIQPSLVLCQTSDLGAFYFKLEVLFEVSHYYKSNPILLLLPYSGVYYWYSYLLRT